MCKNEVAGVGERRKIEGERHGDRRLAEKEKKKRRGKESEKGRERGSAEGERAELFLSSRVGAAIFPSS